jgi:hypothetical protein
MGKYQQGVFGPYSGRVGNVIGTFWKGRCVMRIRAANFTDANSIAQQTQRMKWKLISSFLHANDKLIKMGLAKADDTLTPYNVGIRINITKAVTGVFPELKLDATKLEIAKGSLANLTLPVVTSTVAGKIEIAWTDNSNNEGAKAEDKIYLSLLDTVTGEVVMHSPTETRIAEATSITVPTSFRGHEISVLGFCKMVNVTNVTSLDQVSDSAHFGTVVVAAA